MEVEHRIKRIDAANPGIDRLTHSLSFGGVVHGTFVRRDRCAEDLETLRMCAINDLSVAGDHGLGEAPAGVVGRSFLKKSAIGPVGLPKDTEIVDAEER
jgi:hypothetical protein